MRKTALIVVLLAAAALLCWYSFSDREPLPPANAAAADAAGAAHAPVDLKASPVEVPVAAPAAIAPGERTEAPPVPATLPMTTLLGRCVDELGNGIEGVRCELTGWGANDQRISAWTASNPMPERISMKSVTAADGAFRFQCWPPPPFQFSVRLQGDGRATLGDRWSDLKPGSTVDLGDLRMPLGTLLRGRVVDTDGTPVKAEVHFNLVARDAAVPRQEDWDIGYGKDDGTFQCRWSLAQGDYKLDIPHRDIERPKQVTLQGDRELFVEVVLRKIDVGASLSGVVVDEQGKPVQGATLNAMPSPGGRGWMNSSDRDGRFRLTKPEAGSDDQVKLQASRDGFENLSTEEKYAWGRDDLRLVMRRGIVLEVSVVAQQGGAPVEEFQLYAFPADGGFDSRSFRARATGKHEGGRVTVAGLLRRRHQVVVMPKDEALAISALVPVEIADPGPVRVTVQVPAKVRRPVRVQRADGSPVAGVPVHLVDRLDVPAGEQAMVLALSEWSRTTGRKLLLVHKVTTGADGTAELQGPAGRTFAVEVPGPGHVPAMVSDVKLDAAFGLVITVSNGGRLQGTIGPAEALTELRRLAGPATGRVEQQSARLPGIALWRGEGKNRERFPDRQQTSRAAEDGSFTLEGIPPGSWNVEVSCYRHIADGMGTSQSEPGGAVTLRDGETTQLAIDLSTLLPGTIDGRVLHNGLPLAKGKLSLTGASTQSQVTTDEEGRFQVIVRPGDYRLTMGVQAGERWTQLRAMERAAVVRGQTTTQTFQLRSAQLRLRLCTSDGQPAPDVTIMLRDAADEARFTLPPTGADGGTGLEIDAETMTAFVLPKRLQSPEAQQEVWRNNRGSPDPLAGMRLRLGPVTPVVGESKPIELRLPPEWGQ